MLQPSGPRAGIDALSFWTPTSTSQPEPLRSMVPATAPATGVRSSAARWLLSLLHLLHLLRVALLHLLSLLLVPLLHLLRFRFISLLLRQLLMFVVLLLLEFPPVLVLLRD